MDSGDKVLLGLLIAGVMGIAAICIGLGYLNVECQQKVYRECATAGGTECAATADRVCR
jgi:hypothetical protein